MTSINEKVDELERIADLEEELAAAYDGAAEAMGLAEEWKRLYEQERRLHLAAVKAVDAAEGFAFEARG